MDRYVANLFVRPPTPQILDFGGGFWILDFGDFGFWGFWGFWILDFGDFGFWILDLGILDFGFWDKFWILHKKKKTVQADPGRRISTEMTQSRSSISDDSDDSNALSSKLKWIEKHLCIDFMVERQPPILDGRRNHLGRLFCGCPS